MDETKTEQKVYPMWTFTWNPKNIARLTAGFFYILFLLSMYIDLRGLLIAFFLMFFIVSFSYSIYLHNQERR